MYYPSSVFSVVVLLSLLKYTGAAIIGDNKKNLHHHMTKREVEHYFGVKDHSEIPEYDVTTPRQTESNGRVMSHFRRRRSVVPPDVLHYKLHAFGSKLKLRLKRNSMLMAPNLVIETHAREGVVTIRLPPKNKFYLGKLPSDPDSMVALRSDRGLTGLIRTSRDTFFVQPLPTHLAKRVRRTADSTPHLIYRATPLKKDASGCQMKISVNDRFKRSTNHRKPNATSNKSDYKFIEAALVVPQHFVDKYGKNRFVTVLLVIANMVAGMYQDPSIGKIKIYYVVTKIIHIKSTEETLGFPINKDGSTKLNKLLHWSKRYMTKEDSDPEHFDVFSYITNKMVGGLAIPDRMCDYKTPNGNINSDVGLQTALYIAHETGHNMNLAHDETPNCPGKYIMAATLPSGVYAATWSNCSRKRIQGFLRSDRSRCLDNSPFEADIRTLPLADQNKLPGEIFDGNDQCEMQYGKGYKIDRPGVCDKLICNRGGVIQSHRAPVADGTPCGQRHWCIGGKCEDNGKKRINGGWTSWSSSYSPCTRACDGGVQFRKRNCTNPRPTYGGKPCEGSDKEWRICNSEPCAEGPPTLRQKQCTENWSGSRAYFHGRFDPCFLLCNRHSTVKGNWGYVKDGTRCYSDKQKVDVCVQGKCRKVGCDHILDSNTMVDRCGKCGGDGDECLKVNDFYDKTHTVKGPENADLIAGLPIGTKDVYFQMMKATHNSLGIQDDNGTYLVGGHLGMNQQVDFAGTTIIYIHKRGRSRDKITIKGPTNSSLRVMYIYKRGSNPGLEYNYMRPVQAGETPPKSEYQWKIDAWSGCSATCGQGVRTRSMRCIRSDDQSPATDKACGNKPPTKEKCSLRDCPSEWHTEWTDCSKSCGKGQQTREVICLMKITANQYVQSNNCSNKTRPVDKETIRSCNSFACKADWDTEGGLPDIECGDPIDPKTLFCYRMDQFGARSLVSSYLCRLRPKPTRLPCTTPSTAPPPVTLRSTTFTSTTSTTSTSTSTSKTTKRGQAVQVQCSGLLTLLVLLLHPHVSGLV